MKDDKRQINKALKSALLRLTPEPGKIPTAIEGIHLYRKIADERIDCFNEPCIGVIVQGEKRAIVADEEYRFGEGDYIAYGMDLPAISHISGATPAKPHLALSIPLDRYILNQLAAGMPPPAAAGIKSFLSANGPKGRIQPGSLSGNRTYKGVTVAEIGGELLEACLRLVNLLDTPERIPVIAPMIIREIHYYLLTGSEGEDFRLLGTYETANNQIARAITWLRENYREPFNLAKLAGQVNMSPTSFSRHFGRITGTSPLQFQKRLRLYEAQRMMLMEDKSAETVAYEVGYDSPTQFNREYKRQFGDPPHRDIDRLLATGRAAAYGLS